MWHITPNASHSWTLSNEMCFRSRSWCSGVGSYVVYLLTHHKSIIRPPRNESNLDSNLTLNRGWIRRNCCQKFHSFVESSLRYHSHDSILTFRLSFNGTRYPGTRCVGNILTCTLPDVHCMWIAITIIFTDWYLYSPIMVWNRLESSIHLNYCMILGPWKQGVSTPYPSQGSNNDGWHEDEDRRDTVLRGRKWLNSMLYFLLGNLFYGDFCLKVRGCTGMV